MPDLTEAIEPAILPDLWAGSPPEDYLHGGVGRQGAHEWNSFWNFGPDGTPTHYQNGYGKLHDHYRPGRDKAAVRVLI